MNLGPPITSRTNARVKALRAGLSGVASRPGELVAIEGEKLIGEALGSVASLQTVFVREGSEDILLRLPLRPGQVQDWALVAREIFDGALETRSPQGIAATFPIPEMMHAGMRPAAGVSLVVAGLQDPGNMGTLLRSAEAFVVKQLFVTQDTVNVWNPKSIRASAGSVFRMPVWRGSFQQIGDWLRLIGGPTFAAVAGARYGLPVTDVSLLAPCALMIGNEGSGLSAEALSLADESIWIPCATESLNAAAAGAVLMYESMRQNLLQSNAQRAGQAR